MIWVSPISETFTRTILHINILLFRGLISLAMLVMVSVSSMSFETDYHYPVNTVQLTSLPNERQMDYHAYHSLLPSKSIISCGKDYLFSLDRSRIPLCIDVGEKEYSLINNYIYGSGSLPPAVLQPQCPQQSNGGSFGHASTARGIRLRL